MSQEKQKRQVTCPYCEELTETKYDNEEECIISYVSKLDESIITDSFFEIDVKSLCQKCKKEFHFMVDLRG